MKTLALGACILANRAKTMFILAFRVGSMAEKNNDAHL